MAAKKRRRKKRITHKVKFKGTLLSPNLFHVLVEAPGKKGSAPWRDVSSFESKEKALAFERDLEES